MSRWKVRRKNAMFIHPHEGDLCYGPRWTITSPTGVDWGNKATWAGAMAKADRQARTVEITLPRHTATPTGRHVITGSGTAYIVQYRHSAPEADKHTFIELAPGEVEGLARALLAKHYKELQ